MSTQMEFMMQLYMMNLMQQQQQQLLQQQHHQHQQQLQSPTKPIPSLRPPSLLAENTTTITTTTTTPTTPKQTRTQKRKNSHANNCSSSRSRSCSPNSNASLVQPSLNYPNSSNNCSTPTSSASSSSTSSLTSCATNLSLQQMLLNNIAPMTQLMPQLIPPYVASAIASSNLLLTPTTPNSALSMMSSMDTVMQSQSQALLAGGNNIADSILSLHHHHNNNNNNNTNNQRNSIANNFLQSSTVTSTPTENSPAPLTMEQDVSEVIDVKLDDAQLQQFDDHDNANDTAGGRRLRLRSHCRSSEADDGVDNGVDDDVDCNAVERDYDEEDEKPLSSLHSSSGSTGSKAASLSGANSERSKPLMMSGVQALDSTDSLDSPSMPETPVKQSADSSFNCYNRQQLSSVSNQPAITSSQSAIVASEDSNLTPLTLPPKTILTPPSSEQIMTTSCNNFDTQTQNGTVLTTPSGLDAFLQNEENLKNLKKFSSYLECENILCRQENLREHFHCFDEPCHGKILSKKDDIIRHLKWHKKRKESLLLGFARFSSSDDCEPGYGAGCAYNWKQTHYHCIYEDCPKVYVSTSDVQMHANFHRKNSEIVQEGFRRFRAHENCKIEDCPFYGRKISHYHCCREGCQHTFKNKADMDKHKTYHLKDFQLTQDGFKKILKTETCPFEDCKFSGVCNHIHCVRENCNYILHSSSQMISHKRKHDRLDGEQAYQTFKKQKDSSEEESPKPVVSANNVSTPLSSLTADHFLARKRGRPPKKIQLPTETNNGKRIKMELQKHQLQSTSSALSNIFPPFLPNFNPAAVAQNLQASTDPNAANTNFQLTHLMALFQLQNPLFYQNLYPGGMANFLAGAAASSNILPQNSMLGNLAAFGAAAAADNIKTELSDNVKQTFKE